MRAQVLTRHGDPENLELRELPSPSATAGTVLVRVAATSVNPVDVKIRRGLPIGPALPAVLGADVAGTVEAVGAGVAGFAPGDEVYGCAGGVKGHGGALAEYLAADARLVAHKPRRLSMREAAALPLVTITAWEALERCAAGAGDHVLVHGGTGGVGHVAVQLAKALGARVAATVSTAEAARLARGLGADETILHREEEVGAYVARLTAGRGFDVVIDTVGGGNLDSSFEAAALEARVATTHSRSTHDLSPLHSKALSLHVVFMLLPLLHGRGRERHGRILQLAAAMCDEGKLRPLVDERRFGLEDAPEAHRLVEAGGATGKVVVEIS